MFWKVYKKTAFRMHRMLIGEELFILGISYPSCNSMRSLLMHLKFLTCKGFPFSTNVSLCSNQAGNKGWKGNQKSQASSLASHCHSVDIVTVCDCQTDGLRRILLSSLRLDTAQGRIATSSALSENLCLARLQFLSLSSFSGRTIAV